MIIAVEDVLSEAVARRIIATVDESVQVAMVIGLKGNAYLRERARHLNRTARSVPVFLLTDLDVPALCPANLRKSWIGDAVQPQLLFRVAVVEVESWVLADREELAAMLQIPDHRIPQWTDAIERPKEFLISLARRSRSRDVREDIVPDDGSTAKVGPAYNARLTSFVATRWNAIRAAKHSKSLERTLRRVRTSLARADRLK
jgi:hypothetical protein